MRQQGQGIEGIEGEGWLWMGGYGMELFYELQQNISIKGACMSKSKSQGQLYLILKNHNFLREELKSDQIPFFKLMADKLSATLDFHQKYACSTGPSSPHRLTDTLAVLQTSGGQDLLTKTFKKLAIVHLFVRSAAITGYLTEQLAETALAVVHHIQEKDLRTLTKTRGGVLREIGQMLRDLGNRSDIPLPIQQQPSQGVICQLVEKVYRPFCLYLQRVIQDRESYSLVLHPTAPCCPSLQWKVINLSKHLGGIVMELNRICRYFRKDLLGIYSHFAFLITLDVSRYYDLTRIQLSKNCQILRKRIEELSILKMNDYRAYQQEKEEVIGQERFIDVRRQLQELSAIREDLIWVYLNKELRSCMKHLRRPINGIQVEIDRTAGHITYLLAFIDQQHSSCSRPGKTRRTSIQLKESEEVWEKSQCVQISTGLSLEEGQTHFTDFHN